MLSVLKKTSTAGCKTWYIAGVVTAQKKSETRLINSSGWGREASGGSIIAF